MSVHEDTLQGLKEALEFAKGNITLKTTVIDTVDQNTAVSYDKPPYSTYDTEQVFKVSEPETKYTKRTQLQPYIITQQRGRRKSCPLYRTINVKETSKTRKEAKNVEKMRKREILSDRLR